MPGNKRNISGLLVVLLALSLGLPACSSTGGKVYNAGEAQQVQQVQFGTLLAVEDVRVEGDGAHTGAILGGVTGAAVGSLFGGGSGRVLSVVGGALAGGVLGAGVEGQARSFDANQLTVELENGSTIVVVQRKDEQFFTRGDRVRVISSGQNAARVQVI